MVAPRAETVFTFGVNRRPVGIVLFCPDCEGVLRCETPQDFPPGQCPDLVAKAGPLGFVVRCDTCGFRIALKGDRLPTVSMLRLAELPSPDHE